MNSAESETFAEKVARVEAEKAAQEAAKKAEMPLGLGGTPFEAGHGYARRFPIDRLPAQMRAYVSDIAVRKQVPVDLPALTMLGMLGVVAGPRFMVRRDTDWSEPTNIYTCCGLDSGAGKTPAVDEIRKGAWLARQQLAEKAVAVHAQEVEDLEQRAFALRDQANHIGTHVDERKPLHNKADELDEELKALRKEGPTTPKLMFDGDITPERLIEKMSGNGDIGSIVDDEGTFFRIIAGLYSGGKTGNLGLLLKAWDAKDYEQERVGNGAKQPRTLDRGILSLVLSPQPSIVASVLRNQMMNDTGFINRFIVCLPGDLVGMRANRPSTYHRDAPEDRPDRTLQHWWARLLAELVAYDPIKRDDNPDAAEPSTLHLTRGAWKRHVEYADEFETRMHPGTGKLVKIRAWGAKHLARILRLAGLLHLAAGNSPDAEIAENVMEDAIAIGEWTIDHYLNAGGVAGLSDEAGRIKEFVDGSEYGFVLRSELFANVFAKRLPTDQLSAALDELKPLGYNVAKQPTGGRPKWFVLAPGIAVPKERPNEGGGDGES